MMALTKEDLQALQAMFVENNNALKAEIGNSLKTELAPIQERLVALEDKITPMQESLIKLEKLPHQLQLVAEAVQHTNDKIDRMQGQVDSLETKLNNSVIIKAVTPATP